MRIEAHRIDRCHRLDSDNSVVEMDRLVELDLLHRPDDQVEIVEEGVGEVVVGTGVVVVVVAVVDNQARNKSIGELKED